MKHIHLVFIGWALIVLGQIPFLEESSFYGGFVDTVFILLLVVPVIVIFPTLIIIYLFSFRSGLYKINRGNHYSGYRFKPFFFSRAKLFQIKIYSGWNIITSNGQHNKIVGKNWGLPKYVNGKWVHQNSLRISMVRTSRIGIYRIFYYGYYKGKRLEPLFLRWTKDYEKFEKEISKEKLLELVNNNLENQGKEQLSEIKLPSYGYYLFPYHGGEVPAERDCSVDIYRYDKSEK